MKKSYIKLKKSPDHPEGLRSIKVLDLKDYPLCIISESGSIMYDTSYPIFETARLQIEQVAQHFNLFYQNIKE